MLEIESPAEMLGYIGKELGVSNWLEIDQKTIDWFAEVTGDHQWIHVDTSRAATEMPDGKTIAHGLLTLSLLPRLRGEIFRIRRYSRSINYGLDRARFITPVKAGSRVRLVLQLKACEPIKGGYRLTYFHTIEIEGESRPALVAETISLAYD